MPRRPLLLALLLVPLVACGPTQPAGDALEGRYWDVAAGEFIDFPTLVDRLADREHILVGEQHDHPGHHALQGRLVEALARRGQRRALVAEMFDAEDAPALARLRTSPPTEATAVAEAVAWSESGWPAFEVYQPVFAAALAAEWPLHAGNPDRTTTLAVHREGFSALKEERRAALGLHQEPPTGIMAALVEEVREAHCGHGDAGLFQRQARVQYLRDAWMADRLRDASSRAGTLLIAGTGHVRKDHAIPFHLARQNAGSSVAVLQLRATPEAPISASEAAAEGPPADFIAFTERRGPTDPCAAYREALEAMGEHGGED